jgi:hypothetical protein
LDADRFDHLSRSFADRVSRRSAVKNLGGGGLIAAALAGLGISRSDVFAQADTATCALDIVANVRVGPDLVVQLGGQTPGELRGQLRFAIGEQGRLIDAKLRLTNNMEFNAVGQVAGPAVTIRIAVPPNQTIVLVGAGENALRSCNGAVDGMMTGPAVGDLGDWHAVASQTGNQPPPIQPTQAPAFVPTQPAPPPAGPTESGAATETPTPVADQVATETPTMQLTEAPTEAPTEMPTATTACLTSGSLCTSGQGSECCSGQCLFIDILHCTPGDQLCFPLYEFVCQ